MCADMMATPFLELSPDYQRDVVWSGDRMTKLINSLICPCISTRLLFSNEIFPVDVDGP